MDATALARALECDLLPPLTDAELAAVLGWLGRSIQPAEVARLEALLGAAGDNRQLTARILDQLDGLLFANGELDLVTAGLAPSTSLAHSRRRFRALLGAFHPDRFPWHSDWLTSRFQAINSAYADFKSRALEQDDQASLTVPVPVAKEPADEDQFRGIAPGGAKAASLLRLLRNDQWLPHKLVGVLSLLLILPLLSWWLDDGWLGRMTSGRDDMMAAEREIGPDDFDAIGAAILPPEPTSSVGDAEQPSGHSPDQKLHPIMATGGAPADSDEPDSAASRPADRALRAAEADDACRQVASWHLQLAQLTEAFGLKPAEPGQTDLQRGLQRGALDKDALAEVLELYRRSIEEGDLDRLMRQLVGAPRANMDQGRRWFNENYRLLFELSKQRQLTISVIDIHRQGDAWIIDTNYQLSLADHACGKRHSFQRGVRFHLVQDPLVFRIGAMEY
ncbi:MAG: J domain-containing protein [Wenzhouxiangella sp.]|nr:J domain-containing protein [Wenzhouxiangella sp.]MCH8477938.1 J domain-containing protein [Wenzhouxiangella sp.]